MRQIYLDYNATTPVAAEVREALYPFFDQHFGNPSSSHALGRAAAEAVDDARTRVGRLLNCTRQEIVFTSGGTEANNLALKGVLEAVAPKGKRHLVVSAIEHPAVRQVAEWLARQGHELSIVGCARDGVVHVERIAAAIRSDTALVSLMLANNETGVLQPVREIAELCRTRGVLLHTDAAQVAGKVAMDVAILGVDLLTLAGHKFYAPKGVGALYVRQGTPLVSVVHGAGHERGLRAGTENVPLVVGLGYAAELAARALDTGIGKIESLRDQLESLLTRAVDGLIVHGASAPRLPNTLFASFPGADAHAMLRQCPELCAATGSACHRGASVIGSTLGAMGVADDVARGSIRLSLGRETTRDEIDAAASLLVDAWERSRG